MIYIQKGNEKVVELLINGGADVNAQNNYGWTPLHLAVSGTPKIDEMFIGKQNSTPLYDAPLIGDPDKQYAIIELLLNNGADVNLKNADDKTPLDLAENERGKFLIAFFPIHFIQLIISILFCS